MKIVIREPQGKNFRLVLPSGLLFNRVSALILTKAMEHGGVSVRRDQAVVLIREINRCRRKYRNWTLVQVESAEGEYVEIKL